MSPIVSRAQQKPRPGIDTSRVLKRKSTSTSLDTQGIKAPKNTPSSSPVTARPSRSMLSGNLKDDDHSDFKENGVEAQVALIAKERKFLSASKFAVVGASDDPTKWGSKVMRYLLEQKKDVVPVNPNRETVLGKACLKTIKDLPDPAHTSVSIVVPPEMTLKVLKEAANLDVFCFWLQPGAENDTVLEYIKDTPGLEDSCIHVHASESQDEVQKNNDVVVGKLEGDDPVGPVCSDGVDNPSVVDNLVESPLKDSPTSTTPISLMKSSSSGARESGASGTGEIKVSHTTVAPCLIRDGGALSRISSMHEEIPGLA